MTSLEDRKKTRNGYCIKLFKQSIKEMGHSEKVHGPHGKSPEGKDEQYHERLERLSTPEKSLSKVSGTPEKISDISLTCQQSLQPKTLQKIHIESSDEKVSPQKGADNLIMTDCTPVTPERCQVTLRNESDGHFGNYENDFGGNLDTIPQLRSSSTPNPTNDCRTVENKDKVPPMSTEINYTKSLQKTPVKEIDDNFRPYRTVSKELTPPKFLKYKNELGDRRDSNNNIYSSRHWNTASHAKERSCFGNSNQQFRSREINSKRHFVRNNFESKKKADVHSDKTSYMSNNEHKESMTDRKSESEDWSSDLLNVSDWNNDNIMEDHFSSLNINDDEKGTDDSTANTETNRLDLNNRLVREEHFEEKLNCLNKENQVIITYNEFKREIFNGTGDRICSCTDIEQASSGGIDGVKRILDFSSDNPDKMGDSLIRNNIVANDGDALMKFTGQEVVQDRPSVVSDEMYYDTENNKQDAHLVKEISQWSTKIDIEENIFEPVPCDNTKETESQVERSIDLNEVKKKNNTISLGNESNAYTQPDNIQEIMNYMPPAFIEDDLYISQELSTISDRTESNSESTEDRCHSEVTLYKLNAQAYNSIEAGSDCSTHGDVYDKLIKEKMESIRKTVTNGEKIGAVKSCDINMCERSNSLPGSPYTQILDLVHNFKCKEAERNLLLEQQKIWQEDRDKNSTLDTNKVQSGCGSYLHDNERKQTSSGLENSISSVKNRQNITEDWDSDLLSSKQYVIFDTRDLEDEASSHASDNEQKFAMTHTLEEGTRNSIQKPQVVPSTKRTGCHIPRSHGFKAVQGCLIHQGPAEHVDMIPNSPVGEQRLCGSLTSEETVSKELKSPCPERNQIKCKVTTPKSYTPVGRGLLSPKSEQEQVVVQSLKSFVPKGRGVLTPGTLDNIPDLETNKSPTVEEKRGFDIFKCKKDGSFEGPTEKKGVSKGRGCLSQNFEDNMMDFLVIKNDERAIPPARHGFDMRKYNEPLIKQPHDLYGSLYTQEQKEPRAKQSTMDNIIKLEIQGTENEPKEKQPVTVINLSYEEECFEQATSECDSSLSSKCEFLSAKSQSTLNEVPTMPDFEMTENSHLDETRDDVQDDILDENFDSLEPFVKKDFDIGLDGKINNNKETLELLYEGEENLEPSEINDEVDYTSYYYPDVLPCHCHPSLHQFWVWHSCMCQAPRLCEIRTCHNYWMPHEAMEGIYHTVPIPEVSGKKSDKGKKESLSGKKSDKGKKESLFPHDQEHYASCFRDSRPPGFTEPSRRGMCASVPQYMPPAPPSRQIWERMHTMPSISPYRMSYRGPSPATKEKPATHGQHQTQHTASPFVCAQEFYERFCGNKKGTNRHKNKSNKENELDDSGVVTEGSPSFIGPVLPKNVRTTPWKDIVNLSTIDNSFDKSKSIHRKRLVDYSYSETDESEDDRSRSSQAEKRPRESTDVVKVHDSTSEEETSENFNNSRSEKSDNSKSSSEAMNQSHCDFRDKNVIDNALEGGEIIEDSDEGSSKFHDCSSTFSNYQILQTVLNQKFPKKQRKKSFSMQEDESEAVDLTDEGSEILSVASQESSEKDQPARNIGRGYPYSYLSEHNTSPICGYPVMFPPYGYPGWVSPDMLSSMYSPGHDSQHCQYSTSNHEYTGTPKSEVQKQIISSPGEEKTMCQNTPSPSGGTRRHLTVSPAESGFSETPERRLSQVDRDVSPRPGVSTGRGISGRMRFLHNSKLMDNDATFQARLAALQKNKQLENSSQSDSQSSVTSTWKIRFLNNCRKYSEPFIDSHCHIDFLFNRSEFGGTWSKYKKVNADTFPQNFAGCVAVFCHPSSFRTNGMWNDIAEEKDVWITFGCHPKNATEYTERTENNLKLCLKHPKVVALGEIGLDYSSIFEKHKAVQQIVFRKQIQIALDMNKPLVIHCRDAEDDTLKILDEMVPKNYKIHCHCFTGNYESAKKWMDMFPNLFIGLTPLVTFRSATPTHEVARFIPLERLLLETDAPYFIPRKCPRSEFPFSHPGMAITVAEEVSWLKKCPIEEVLYSCRQNTRNMYGI